ncbi:MAG: hypothetical protein JXR83_04145 [Deltaproteobacteria bacterium]|nr:hypothetical protein [Deltaproteobacteria bacterium]
MRGHKRTRARRTTWAGLALLLADIGCGPTTVIEVAPPLTVVDTFPANGASLRGAEVSHVEVVFSESVEVSAAVSAIRLESVNSGDEVITHYALAGDPERGDNGFDENLLMLSLTIGEPSSDGALPDNTAFRLTIGAGLTARSGGVLPVDVIRRFATALP